MVVVQNVSHTAGFIAKVKVAHILLPSNLCTNYLFFFFFAKWWEERISKQSKRFISDTDMYRKDVGGRPAALHSFNAKELVGCSFE